MKLRKQPYLFKGQAKRGRGIEIYNRYHPYLPSVNIGSNPLDLGWDTIVTMETGSIHKVTCQMLIIVSIMESCVHFVFRKPG